MDKEADIKSKTKNEPIRTYFDENNGKWYFSIVDVVAIVTESTDPRNYWKVLKNRLKTKHNQLVTNCNQLKMESSDGKYYFTDVGDKENVLGIVEFLDSTFIPHFRRYFDTFKHKKSQNIISLKKLSTLNENDKFSASLSYPQQDKNKDTFSKKIKIKSI